MSTTRNVTGLAIRGECVEAEKSSDLIDRRLSVAPMMDWTDDR